MRDSWRAVSVIQRHTVSSSPPINLICTCRRCHALHRGRPGTESRHRPAHTLSRHGQGLSTRLASGEHWARNLGRLLPSSYSSPSAIPSPSSPSPACAPSPGPPSPPPSPPCTSAAHDEAVSAPGAEQARGQGGTREGRARRACAQGRDVGAVWRVGSRLLEDAGGHRDHADASRLGRARVARAQVVSSIWGRHGVEAAVSIAAAAAGAQGRAGNRCGCGCECGCGCGAGGRGRGLGHATAAQRGGQGRGTEAVLGALLRPFAPLAPAGTRARHT